MTTRLQTVFLLLALSQAAHSLEEYFGRLWEVFAPARYLSTLASPANPEVGFVVINTLVVVLVFWCYFRIVRRDARSARAWIWFWVLLESINGIGHVAWSATSGQYQPGLLTALPFLVIAPLLVREVTREQPISSSV